MVVTRSLITSSNQLLEQKTIHFQMHYIQYIDKNLGVQKQKHA